MADAQTIKFCWRSGSPSGYRDCFPDSSLLGDTESGIGRLRCATLHCRHAPAGIAISITYRASTSMYSLTFRVPVTTPRSVDEMKRRTQLARPFYRHFIARGVFAGMRSVRVRHACGGPGGLPLGYATHLHSVAIATQPVHRLQICPIMHN